MISTRCEGRSERPVGKIVAVGRNYADHAAEMGAPRPAEPILFLKPSTALVIGDDLEVALPGFSQDVHHEVELVVRLARELVDASVDDARHGIDAVGVGLDLTARDLQAAAKKAGLPWAVAKGFDRSAPLSMLAPCGDCAELADLDLELRVGGAVRQAARTSLMLWNVAELLAFASSRFRLEPGDLVFTGTPAGVGPIRAGDVAEARLGTLARLRCRFC